jgi:hypothetical protein
MRFIILTTSHQVFETSRSIPHTPKTPSTIAKKLPKPIKARLNHNAARAAIFFDLRKHCNSVAEKGQRYVDPSDARDELRSEIERRIRVVLEYFAELKKDEAGYTERDREEHEMWERIWKHIEYERDRLIADIRRLQDDGSVRTDAVQETIAEMPESPLEELEEEVLQ